ncbi:MAG: cytochrome P450 [Xanthomonadales bacterium]|nr:cytochrome P450 [Xanthomonadales bacterium]
MNETTAVTRDDDLLEADIERWMAPGHPERAELIADPYPLFDRIRERNPVYRTRQGPWIVTRFDDVAEILRDHRWSRDAEHARFAHLHEPPPENGHREQGALEAMFGTWMLYADPPEHTRLRRLVNRSFTPRAIADREERVAQIIQDLIEDLRARDRFDVRHDFANVLTATVMCELIGMPMERFEEFAGWSGALIRLQEPDVTGEEARRARASLEECIDFFEQLIAQRRRAPTDDVISHLLETEREERVTHEEIIGMCMMLHVAGHETTSNRITNATYYLLQHPDQHRLVRREPDRTTDAIEETLRMSSTGPLPRYATEDITVGDTVIPTGAIVIPSQGAANRDPDRFAEPHRFDVSRENASEHIAFGAGLHYCLGVHLARLEATSALRALMTSPRALEATGDDIRWRDSFVVRGLEALPVSWSNAGEG